MRLEYSSVPMFDSRPWDFIRYNWRGSDLKQYLNLSLFSSANTSFGFIPLVEENKDGVRYGYSLRSDPLQLYRIKSQGLESNIGTEEYSRRVWYHVLPLVLN